MSRRRVISALAGGLLAATVPLASTAPGTTAVAATPAPATAQPATWHSAQARIPAAQDPGRSGEGALVAVIDTWVDGSHPDFGGRVLVGARCAAGTCTAGQVADPRCTHGTHVAGTVASSSYGVAPRARILPVQVLTYDPASAACTGDPADVAAGVRYAVGAGARVLNLSLGGLVPLLGQDAALTAAVHDAAGAGVLVVFAAGNSSVPVTDNYGTDALLVAATGPSGGLASYSQSGAGVALAAPGGDSGVLSLRCNPDGSDCVRSLAPGGGYALMQGTSMAAPHVAGIAALLLGEVPDRGRGDVIGSLRSTARPLAGAGSGLVDATAALALRPPTSPPVGAGAPTSGSGGGGPAGAAGAPAGRRAPALTGCPRALAVQAGRRAQVRCATRPATRGAAVVLQQRDARGRWVTVSKMRTDSRGRFHAQSRVLRTATRLRVVLGRSTAAIPVSIRR